MKKLIYNFELSDEAYDLLLSISKTGSVEYLDPEYPTLKDFQENRPSSTRSDNWFFNRNFGGTYYLISDLAKFNLIDIRTDNDHTLWELSIIGKEIIKQNKAE